MWRGTVSCPHIFLEPDGRPRKADAAVLKGSWGAQIIDELTPAQDEYVVHKQRFNAFYQTELELMLRCWHIDTLIVCGMITEVCVESTIREALCAILMCWRLATRWKLEPGPS